MENVKKIEEQELDEIVGGAFWETNHLYQDTYNKAGIETDWTLNPFVRDKFKFKGTSIDDNTAKAIVFYVDSQKGKAPNNVGDALIYRQQHIKEYCDFVKRNTPPDYDYDDYP